MTTTSKPFGIVATLIYAAIGGVLSLLSGLLLLFASSIPGSDGLIFTLGGILFTVLGVLYLAAVYGLKSLLEWGRQLMFWLSVASIPLGVISIFPVWPGEEMTSGNTVLQIVGIGISVLIIFYLSKSTTKSLFI